MEPTLQNGNALLLKKWGVPQKGDIVTAYIDELDYTVVKRILAAEGDTVNIDESTCLWVLLDLMDQKKIEQHFLASKEEYPIRIVFVGDGEIFDILYVAPEDIELTNQLFVRRKIDGCGHVVVVEEAESIPKIQVSDVVGYCTVKEDGEVEYYRKESR